MLTVNIKGFHEEKDLKYNLENKFDTHSIENILICENKLENIQ